MPGAVTIASLQPHHSLTAQLTALARRRGTFCVDSVDADNDHTANMIERFRAIGAPGARHTGGSTRSSRSEGSDEESGELHDVFASPNHIVRPVSRRPPAPASAAPDGSAAPQYFYRA